MSEIKLNREPIDQRLLGIQQATQSLQVKNAKDISGQNNLETVQKLNQLRQSLNEIMESYQQMIKQHTDSTSQALDSLEESERMAARGIQRLRS